MSTKSNTSTRSADTVLDSILTELRLLREKVHLLLPQEELKDYAHPARIRRSYQKAIRQYPPKSA